MSSSWLGDPCGQPLGAGTLALGTSGGKHIVPDDSDRQYDNGMSDGPRAARRELEATTGTEAVGQLLLSRLGTLASPAYGLVLPACAVVF